METFTEQPSVWYRHLRTFVCTISKKKNLSQSAVYSHVADCSSCCRCIVRVDFRVFRKKKSRFLDDVHIVEALNEPVDDSGSEGGVSEMEYSPSDSDSSSGM